MGEETTLGDLKNTKRREPAHVAQCYRTDETLLVQNVARFLKEGLDLDRSLLIIATPSHRSAFIGELKRIGALSQPGWPFGGFVLLDASDTLSRLMVAGEPDAARFEQVVGTSMRDALSRNGNRGVRAYGDMVGELWKSKRYAAAARLENLWNDLQSSADFDLFCGYPLDVFADPFDSNAVDALLKTHTHLIAGEPRALEGALQRAFSEIIGDVDGTLDDRVLQFHQRTWANMPNAELMIMWLRRTMPDRASAVLERAEAYQRVSS